ncbi:type IV toxin-antitoxin system AbiEi family antitoxin domain-containing protein [Nocardioides marinquilinus]
MHPRVVGHLATSGGLITRSRALDLGVGPSELSAHVRTGRWVIVHRGVYADAEVWESLDEWRGRPLLRAKAAVLAMKRAWVLSHDSAAHAHGLEMLAPERAYAHITRPGHTNAWTKGHVKHHLARYRPQQVVDVDGHATLDVARTVCDVAREHGLRAGLVTADSALRRGVTRGDLWEAVDVMRHWPYVTTVREIIDLADPGAESAIESLGRELVIGLGIGEPETQFPIRLADGRVRWCDIRIGRHVVETHGLVKVLTPEQGGVADREARSVVFDERKREREITDEGLGVTNLYWDDFFGAGRARAAQRLMRDWEHTVARYGTALPQHLERNAREIRARRDRRTAG